MNRGTKSVIMYHAIYLVRRVIFALTVTYMMEYPCYQVMAMIVVNLIALCVQAHINPLSSKSSNNRAVYDDFTLLMIIDCLICCTEFVSEGEGRYFIGFVIVAITGQCLIVNLFLLLKEFYTGLKLRIRRCCYVRRATKGKTMAFAKKKLGSNLRVKWKNLKNIVTSSDVI